MMTPAEEWALIVASVARLTEEQIREHGNQKKLAQAAGISEGHISNLKAGKAVGIDAVIRLCEVAKRSLASLISAALTGDGSGTPFDHARRRLDGLIRPEAVAFVEAHGGDGFSEREWALKLLNADDFLPKPAQNVAKLNRKASDAAPNAGGASVRGIGSLEGRRVQKRRAQK